MAEKRTPMAWQHRDINYHQNGYQQDTRYSQGVDGSRGPPSTSDRQSHRTDKSWRTRDSNMGYGGPGSSTGPPHQGYHQGPSRESYAASGQFYGGAERPTSRLHSQVTGSSSTTSSSSDEESERDTRRDVDPGGAPSHTSRQPSYPAIYNQNAAGYMTYNGSLKPAHSVPALAMATYDGEPCPVHHMGSMAPLIGHPSMGMLPQQMGPEHMGGYPMQPTMHRKAQSIYDMRLMSPAPPPMPIYGTLPHKPGMIPGDRRSLVGFPQNSGPPPNIPPHFLPPMARPRPLVMSEDGMTEPLPKRSPPKSGFELPMKSGAEDIIDKWNGCSKGAICVAWIILSVICTGVVLGMLLLFIL